MTQQNLVLTEKAIARHTKRLQQELKKLDKDLKLSEAQNMLSRIFGMKDYHELKKIFNLKSQEPVNHSLFIQNKIIPERYKKNCITQRKNNMLEHTLLSDAEVSKHNISSNIITLIDLIITSNKEDVKNFILNNSIDINYQIPGRNWQPKTIFDFAIFFEQYDTLKYLLSLDNINLSNIEEYLITIEAQRNNIEHFQYLCKKLPYTQHTLDMSLLYACRKKGLQHVRFLLTSTELKFNADIHYKKDECLKNAIYAGQLDIVKYLLTSEELSEKPSLFEKSWRDSAYESTDIKNSIAHKIKIYNGNFRRNGEIVQIDFTQSEKDNFFSVLYYLINDYANKELLHWFYVNSEIRPYINKEKIDLEYFLSLIDK